MSNGAFNPLDDDFITSDLQDHVEVMTAEDDKEDEQIGRSVSRRRRRNLDNSDDQDSDFKIEDDNEDEEDNDDNDSDFDVNERQSSGRKRGRPPKRQSASKNGSSTRSGRVVRAPTFLNGEDDDEEDYDFGPKRKRGRPAKSVKQSRGRPPSGPKDRCNLCNVVLRNDTLICEHIQKEHVLPSMNPEDVIIEKTGVKAFLCSICEATFDARIKFKFHKRSKHGIQGDGGEEDTSIECELCEVIVENKSELIKHKDTRHVSLKTYHCDYCNDKYFSCEELVDHRRVMHEDQVNKIVEPWISVKRTEEQVLKEMFPAGHGYASAKRRTSTPAPKKSFPKRVLPGDTYQDELPPSSPEKSPGNTSSSDYEPDAKDNDDDDDFEPGMENSTKKKRSKRSRGRPSRSSTGQASMGRPPRFTEKGLSLESLGIQGLSKEGLENFKSAPPEIQKKVMKLLLDKKGREAVLKRLQGLAPSANSSPGPSRDDRRKTTSAAALTLQLKATLEKLLAKKKPVMFDCPECPHRFASKELLQRHEKSAHTKRPPPRPVFTGTCQICSEAIPNEKDYVQHLLSKHMTPDVDVLSVAANILVKRVAKDPRAAMTKRRNRAKKSNMPAAGSSGIKNGNNSTLNTSTVSNDGSISMGTHDVNSNDASINQSRTTIEPVIDDDGSMME